MVDYHREILSIWLLAFMGCSVIIFQEPWQRLRRREFPPDFPFLAQAIGLASLFLLGLVLLWA